MAPRTPIFNMFGPSPLRPLEQHIDKAHQCASRLLPFFDAAIDQDWQKGEALYQEISAHEQEADQLKRDLRLHLHKDLFLPIKRSDVLNILMHQDHIANKAKDIAGLVIGRRMQLPPTITSDFKILLQRSIDATEQARKAINELDDLLEAGFRGNEAKVVEKMLDELDAIEGETDQQQIKIRQALFLLEKELPPVDCIFLYKVIEWTGALADRAQTVGHQLQILLAH